MCCGISKHDKIQFDPTLPPPSQKDIDKLRAVNNIKETVGLLLLLFCAGSIMVFMDISYVANARDLPVLASTYLAVIGSLMFFGFRLINSATSDYSELSFEEIERIEDVFSKNKILVRYLEGLKEQKRLPVRYEFRGAIKYSLLETPVFKE